MKKTTLFSGLAVTLIIGLVMPAIGYAAPYGRGVYGANTPYGDETSLSISADSGSVTVLAGSTTLVGYLDGIGTAALFNSNGGLDLDKDGNIYVADGNNNRIRKITPSGAVTTFAGSGVAGSANGNGTAAEFNYPFDIAIDTSGIMYVTESGHRIRKITPSGAVTTFAGSGVAGSANGNGTAAEFNVPQGIAVDSSGLVYVADSESYIVRKITPSGAVTTLAGTVGVIGRADGTGSMATFSYPTAIVVDSTGTLYLADADNIRIITPSGVVSTYISYKPTLVDGTLAEAATAGAYGIALSASGVIYVSESSPRSVIRKVSQGGSLTIPITPSDAGGSGASTGAVTVISSDIVGYKLYVRGLNGTNMVNGGSAIAASANGAPGLLAVNTWGYNVDQSNTFTGMTSTDTLIRNFSGPSTSVDSTLVTYSAKVDLTKPAGNYAVNVIYTAVPSTD